MIEYKRLLRKVLVDGLNPLLHSLEPLSHIQSNIPFCMYQTIWDTIQVPRDSTEAVPVTYSG